jgi:hypothetical protein
LPTAACRTGCGRPTSNRVHREELTTEERAELSRLEREQPTLEWKTGLSSAYFAKASVLPESSSPSVVGRVGCDLVPAMKVTTSGSYEWRECKETQRPGY